MKYLPLLSLNIIHDYYEEESCPDFSIKADEQTEKTLRNHRCLLKTNPTGFLILQAVNNDAPFITFSLSTRLRFTLTLVNSDFLLFTDLSNFPNQGFAVYTNKEMNDSTLNLIETNMRQEKNCFAAVEIYMDHSIKPAKNKDPVQYHIPFTAKPAYWEYFFITNETTDNFDFQIKHSEHQEGVSPAGQPIGFKKEAYTSRSITDWINKQYPKANLLYFVSDEPVRCQQAPRENIQLLLNGERLLNNLPNPSIRNSDQRISGDGDSTTTQDTFFHIVKHIKQSFSTTEI